jgi:hypothetical protein
MYFLFWCLLSGISIKWPHSLLFCNSILSLIYPWKQTHKAKKISNLSDNNIICCTIIMSIVYKVKSIQANSCNNRMDDGQEKWLLNDEFIDSSEENSNFLLPIIDVCFSWTNHASKSIKDSLMSRMCKYLLSFESITGTPDTLLSWTYKNYCWLSVK